MWQLCYCSKLWIVVVSVIHYLICQQNELKKKSMCDRYKIAPQFQI